jgi:hypothetical protein
VKSKMRRGKRKKVAVARLRGVREEFVLAEPAVGWIGSATKLFEAEGCL